MLHGFVHKNLQLSQPTLAINHTLPIISDNYEGEGDEGEDHFLQQTAETCATFDV